MPVLVDEEGVLIVGHRDGAATKLGLKSIPVLVARAGATRKARLSAGDNQLAARRAGISISSATSSRGSGSRFRSRA